MEKYKCPNCESVMKFNSKKNLYVCSKCKEKFNANDFYDNLHIFKCNKCNSQFLSSYNIKNCIYCNSKLEDTNNTTANNLAYYIIPFKNKKKDVIKEYNKNLKNKLLLPSIFKNINEKSIKKIFVPVVLYSYNTIGEVEAKTEKTSNFDNGIYKYTKYDEYKAIRNGSMTFENVPYYLSDFCNYNIIKKIEPFNYKELIEYKDINSSNIIIENVSKKVQIKDIENNVKELFIDFVKKDITGYENIYVTNSNVNIQPSKIICALIPVWLLNINYHKKTYTFIMNGQTGKFNMHIPFSKLKIFIMWLIIVLLISSILLAIYYFKVRV